MRRSEFIKGIEQVQEALTTSDLQELFASMLDQTQMQPSESTTAKVLTALKEYTFRAQHFNEAARELTELVDLQELERPEVWSKLIGGVDDEYIRRQQDRINVVMNYLPQIAKMMRRKTERTLEQAGIDRDEGARLTVIVVEEEGHLSSPQRLAELFEGIERLYEVCAVVVGVKAEKLSVLSCESGQDKAFDFVGSPVVIESLKDLILGIWDRVVFYRELELGQRVKRVADSLYILEKIEDMQESGKLGREQAEILRRGVHNGVTKFMESGAIIPEITEQARYDPRELMSPEPKLLTSPAAAAPKPQASKEAAEHQAEAPAVSPGGPEAPAASTTGSAQEEENEKEPSRTEQEEVASILQRITRPEAGAPARRRFGPQPFQSGQESGETSDDPTDRPESPESGSASPLSNTGSDTSTQEDDTFSESIRDLNNMFDELEDVDHDPLDSFSPSSPEDEEDGDNNDASSDEESWREHF